MPRRYSFLPILITLGGCSEPPYDSTPAPGVTTTTSTTGSASDGGGEDGHATDDGGEDGHTTDGGGEDGHATETGALTTGGSTGDDGTTSTETGAPGEELCEAGECVVLPNDWNGPVVRLLGDEDSADEPIGCDAAWPEQVGDVLHANVTGGSASCDCHCNETQAPVCGGQTGTLYMRAGCEGSVLQTWNLSPGNSLAGQNAQAGRSWLLQAGTGTDTAAACGSSNITQYTPELERIGKVRLCAPPEAEHCGDGTCLPPVLAPFGDESNVCVWREGTHACPAEFPAVHTYYRGETDNRACQGCSCSAHGAPCTAARVSLYASGFDGPLSLPVSISAYMCETVSFEPVSFNFTPRLPNTGTCQQTTSSSPTGSVQPSDPVTVCCRG